MRAIATALIMVFSVAAAADVDVYLIAGQSNAHGSGNPNELTPTLQAPYPAVDYYFRGVPNDVGIVLGPLISNSAYFSRFGPELMMGRTLDQMSDNKVAIIKHARGGTTLGADWFAGGDATATGDGQMLQDFYTTVTDGLTALQNKYPGEQLNLIGLAWMQGESDAYNISYANAYANRLRTFTEDVRATLGDDLPIAIGQLSSQMTNFNTVAGYTPVRNAQALIAGEHPLNTLVNTDAVPTHVGDEIHFSTAGQLMLGVLFADALVPEPGSLTVLMAGGAAMLRRRRRNQHNRQEV